MYDCPFPRCGINYVVLFDENPFIIQEIQQGYLAQKHAVVAAKNIRMLMSGEKETKLAVYKPGTSMAIVSLGKRDAVAQFPFLTIAGCIPGMIKSKDLFVGKTRKTMGLKPTLT